MLDTHLFFEKSILIRNDLRHSITVNFDDRFCIGFLSLIPQTRGVPNLPISKYDAEKKGEYTFVQKKRRINHSVEGFISI